MKLLNYLQNQIENEESYFSQYLAKEDLTRIEKLVSAAGAMPREQYLKEFLLIGWSKDDMRTHELNETLIPLMNAVFEYAKQPNEENDNVALSKWQEFHAQRLKVLIHCL